MGQVPDTSGRDDEWTIEEGEAIDAEDSKVDQETLDRLTTDFDPSPDLEPVILDDETEPDEPEASKDMFESEIGELEEDPGEADSDFEDDEDVTQEDIDALLMADEEDDEDIMISQDDIDTLLMAADEEDEDILGDLMEDDDGADSLEDEFEDEDFFDMNDLDDLEGSDDPDPVILIDSDKTKSAEKIEERSNTLIKSGWYKSKLVVACAAALVFLGISVPIGYFMLSGSNRSTESENIGGVASGPIEVTQQFQEPEIEIVDVVVQQPVPRLTTGSIVLKDFIVLAPAQSKNLNYVSMDISIDYSDHQTSLEIHKNIAFYRGIIYDSIRNKLDLTIDQVEVTQADIQSAVEDSLKRVIPGQSINRISLISFKTS